MKNQSFINYLKIRGSYGIVGNDLMNTKSRFFYLPDAYNPYGTSYNFGVDVSGNRDGATELQMGNPLVSWEKEESKTTVWIFQYWMSIYLDL